MSVWPLSEIAGQLIGRKLAGPYATPLRWPGPLGTGLAAQRFIPGEDATAMQHQLAFGHPNPMAPSSPFNTGRDPAREPWPEP